MKKVLLAASLLLSVAAFAAPFKNAIINPVALKDDGGGRHISASQVPQAVMETFNNMFPDARRVQWEVDREDGRRVFEAEFTQNGKRFKAEFAANGKFLGKERDHSGED